MFNVDSILEEIRKCKLPTESQIKKLCKKAVEILFEESNVQPVNAPVTVVGDIHGQFYDVLHLFSLGQEPPDTNYILIGDFVDRGYHSVETMVLLFCFKVKYPSHITLLRGNHECREVTTHYGFYDEVRNKFGNTNVWEYFMDAFNFLPVGAIIEGWVLCIHGGLSPSIKTLDQIRAFDRKVEISQNESLCDLMWSDPSRDIEDWQVSKRGAGYYFGEKVVKNFNLINNLMTIARAHQLVEQGYEYWFDKSLVTVWSAPNYCYRAGNKASFMKVTEELNQEFTVFSSVPQSDNSEMHPTLMPYFL